MKRHLTRLVLSLGIALTATSVQAQTLSVTQTGMNNAAFAVQEPGEAIGVITQNGTANMADARQLNQSSMAGIDIVQTGAERRGGPAGPRRLHQRQCHPDRQRQPGAGHPALER